MTAKHKAAIRRGIKKARKITLKGDSGNGVEIKHSIIKFHPASYFCGKVETAIEFYCVGKTISPAAIAAELGELLRHSEGR